MEKTYSTTFHLIALHFRDSEYGISASPSSTDEKNRSASAEFPFVRPLFSENVLARLINSAPLSFDHHIKYAFDAYSIAPFAKKVNVFLIFLPYKIDK